LTTRLYREGDDEEIVELLRSGLDTWALLPNPLEVWRWKYRDSPLETQIVVSTAGEEVVGVGHCIKINVKLGDRVLTSYYDDDYATKPEYRKKGVYKAVTNLTDKIKRDSQADFCYWITRNPIVLTKAMIHEQVTFPTQFSDLIRVKDVERFIDKYPIEDASMLRSDFLLNKTTSNLDKPIPEQCSAFRFVDIKSFDEISGSFWGRVADGYDYFLMRDRDYMNYRFTKNLGTRYKIKAALYEGEVVGCVILEFDDDEGYLAGSISDLLFVKDRFDVVLPLFDEAISYFDSLNTDCISLTTMQGHPYQKIANSYGFFNAAYASEVHVMFWGYNEYFYDKLSSLRADKTYFSYTDYY